MAIQLEEIKRNKTYLAKLTHGSDLLEELTGICKERNIQLGRIEAIGAVQKAGIGFYDQRKQEYQYITIDEPLEITSLTGNVSIKDGAPFVHVHATLAGPNGRAYGGHLTQGTIIFACECMIETFDGPAFERAFDRETGLSLWKIY